jgi:hypothetical protein
LIIIGVISYSCHQELVFSVADPVEDVTEQSPFVDIGQP